MSSYFRGPSLKVALLTPTVKSWGKAAENVSLMLNEPKHEVDNDWLPQTSRRLDPCNKLLRYEIVWIEHPK